MTDSKRDERKAQLDSLFGQWESREPGDTPDDLADVDDAPKAPDSTRWRGMFALVVVIVSAYVMIQSKTEFFFWWNGEAQLVDMGNLSDRWRDGERELPLSERTYVEMDGMIVTHAMEALRSKADDGDESSAPAKRYFLCPLYDIIVRTSQAFPEARGHRGAQIPIDPAFVELIQKRKAFPEHLETSFKAKGRLVAIADAPLSAQKAVKTFQEVVRRDSDHFYLLIDGETPEDYNHYAFLWGAALVVPLFPLWLFFRALRRRRQGQRA